MNDAEIGKLIASLPYYTLPKDFNRRVLAGLGIAAQPVLSEVEGPAPSPFWLLWAERTAGAIAACWLGAAVFAAALLAAAHYQDILPLLAEPGALLSALKLYALKAGFFAMDMLRFLSIGKAVLADRAGGPYLLPRLALSTLLSVAVIIALSRQAYAQSATRR